MHCEILTRLPRLYFIRDCTSFDQDLTNTQLLSAQSYLDALSSGAAAAPAAPAVKTYLSNVSSGAASAPTSGGGIASYLSSLPVTTAVGGAGIASYLSSVPSNPTPLGGGGITSYLSTVATSPTRSGGAGISSYLDSIHKACDAVQPDTTGCSEAISDYMSAVSSGAAP
jgi:hypothetical protein